MYITDWNIYTVILLCITVTLLKIIYPHAVDLSNSKADILYSLIYKANLFLCCEFLEQFMLFIIFVMDLNP